MTNLIRPEKREQWPEAQRKWFVQNPDDPRDLRFPGKMKEEWSSTNGAIIWYVLHSNLSCYTCLVYHVLEI